MRAIAQNILGDPDKVIFRAIPTNQRIAALENDKVDVVVRTMTINCSRLDQVAFSTAYFQAGQQVLAPKDSPITGYDKSLAGKRVCTAEGSTAYEALEKQSFGAKFKDQHDGTEADEDQLTVPNQLDCLVRLQLGEVDAVVTDNALAAGQAAQDPAVVLKGDKPFTTEYYGVATKHGSERPGAPGQPGAGRLPRGRRRQPLDGVVPEVAGERTARDIGAACAQVPEQLVLDPAGPGPAGRAER